LTITGGPHIKLCLFNLHRFRFEISKDISETYLRHCGTSRHLFLEVAGLELSIPLPLKFTLLSPPPILSFITSIVSFTSTCSTPMSETNHLRTHLETTRRVLFPLMKVSRMKGSYIFVHLDWALAYILLCSLCSLSFGLVSGLIYT
jgi:hypothetical protein